MKNNENDIQILQKRKVSVKTNLWFLANLTGWKLSTKLAGTLNPLIKESPKTSILLYFNCLRMWSWIHITNCKFSEKTRSSQLKTVIWQTKCEFTNFYICSSNLQTGNY